jgi:hypothetical protein
LVTELQCGWLAEHQGSGRRPSDWSLAFSSYVFGGAVKNGELTFSSNLNNRLWAEEALSTGGSKDIGHAFSAATETKSGDFDGFMAGLAEATRRFEAMGKNVEAVNSREHRMDVKAKGAAGMLKGPTSAGTVEVTFGPGTLGCDVNAGNRITKITEGGQLHRAGVQLGWLIFKVDGVEAVDKSRPHPCIAIELLTEKINGDRPYTVTFMIQEGWSPNNATPAVAREHIQEAVRRCIYETGEVYHVSML